jgi:sugar lactone lactonase YvrE
MIPRISIDAGNTGTGADLNVTRVVQLIQSGDKLEAIKLFRRLTNASLEESKNAMEKIGRGESVDISHLTIAGLTPPDMPPSTPSSQPPSTPMWDSVMQSNKAAPRRKGNVFTALAIGLLVIGVIVAIVVVSRKLAFASPSLSFGKEGTGAGMLNDPRHVGVNRNGNIYAGDYGDGRINVFDARGKYLQLINLGPKTYLVGMAVAPDGTLYLSYSGDIHRRDSQGNDTLLNYTNGSYPVYFEDIALGSDGSLVATDENEEIVRFKPDGSVDLVIPNVFSSVTGEDELDIHLAVDGLGNIYALGTFNNLVLKYSPEGKYIDQFGGETTHPAEGVDHGRFEAPDTLAVDGYGRIFVSDIWGVQVFNSNGQYLKFFTVNGVAFGMTFDLDNNLYIASNAPKIIKLTIKKP